MLNLALSTIAQWTQGRLLGGDVEVQSVAIDSRTLKPGALFVALRGEHHDGHDFVEAAQRNGAAAALVERPLATDLPQVVVADGERALGALAAGVRARSAACVVGITGSNGKTTVKTLLAGILSRHAPTHFSSGSFNNEIGLPLTVLSVPPDTRFVVLEMGAGKPGDIAYLAQIAKPRIGLVNNIAPAHLERMGSIEMIARTKGALYSALPADGVAVINADDAFAGCFSELAQGRRVLRFGLDAPADVSARFDASSNPGAFTLVSPAGEIEVSLALGGRHNTMNALAAASLALACAVPLETIKRGLESASAVPGRSARRAHASGAWLIDDTYNANPASFAAAVATLAACSGRRILVAGDMRELGPGAQSLHAQVGELAKASGIDALYAVGELSEATARAFGRQARHFADQATLIEALRDELVAGNTLLIKGSRGSAMDRVVDALLAGPAENGGRHAA